MHTPCRTLLFMHALSSSSTPPVHAYLLHLSRSSSPGTRPLPALISCARVHFLTRRSPADIDYLSLSNQLLCRTRPRSKPHLFVAVDQNNPHLSLASLPCMATAAPHHLSLACSKAKPLESLPRSSFPLPKPKSAPTSLLQPIPKKIKKKILKLLFELHLLYALISISMKHHVSSRNTHNPMVIDVNTDPFPIINTSSSNYSNLMTRNPIAPKNHAIHRQNLIEPNYLAAALNPMASILRPPSLIHCRRKKLHRALTDLRPDPP